MRNQDTLKYYSNNTRYFSLSLEKWLVLGVGAGNMQDKHRASCNIRNMLKTKEKGCRHVKRMQKPTHQQKLEKFHQRNGGSNRLQPPK